MLARGGAEVARPCDIGRPCPGLPLTMSNSATLHHVQASPILYSFPTSDRLSEALADFVIKVGERI